MDYLTSLGFLFGPSLWWMWESMIIITWFMVSVVGKLGKAEVIRLQERNGSLYQVGKKYIPRTVEWFRAKKDEAHTVENDLSPFTDETGIGSKPVLFYKVNEGRPQVVDVKFSSIPHDPKGKNPTFNPSSKFLDRLLKGEMIKQMFKANAVAAHPELMILIVVALAAFFGGVVAAPYINVHQVASYPPAQVTPAH